MDLDLEKRAKASYLWHAKDAYKDLGGPDITLWQMLHFLEWLSVIIVSPFLILFVAYNRKRHAIKQYEFSKRKL